MSGECDECGEHVLECRCNKIGYDDDIVAIIVCQCLQIMRDYPTTTKLTACYNLTERILRLFTIQMNENDVIELINDFKKCLIDDIKEMY